MKNVVIFITWIFLCAPFFLGAQQFGARQANSLDIYFGGGIGYRLLSNNLETPTELEKSRSLEDFKPNNNFGINYNIGIGQSLSIKTGVRYSSTGYIIPKVERIDFSEGIKFDSRTVDFYDGFRYKVDYKLIGIPLGIKYVLSNKSCEPYFELGVVPSYYIQTNIREFDIADNRSNTFSIKEDISDFHLLGFLSVGGNFNISNNVSGFTQLTANYQLNNLRSSFFKENIFGVGVEIGARIHL